MRDFEDLSLRPRFERCQSLLHKPARVPSQANHPGLLVRESFDPSGKIIDRTQDRISGGCSLQNPLIAPLAWAFFKTELLPGLAISIMEGDLRIQRKLNRVDKRETKLPADLKKLLSRWDRLDRDFASQNQA